MNWLGMHSDSQRHWLVSKEAAAFLRIHPKHIYRLLAQGLPAHRVGGQWRFTVAELQAWAKRRKRGERTEGEGNIESQVSTASTLGGCVISSSGDLAAELLVAEWNRRLPPSLGTMLADASSAMQWLCGSTLMGVLVLGDHLAPQGLRLARVHVAQEQFGIVARPGVPLPSITSLSRKRTRLASWRSSSDIRPLFDGVLEREGASSQAIHHTASLVGCHSDVVSLVCSGKVDFGVTTASWARRFGLPFLSLGSRPLGLVVPAAALSQPLFIQCWEVLQAVGFRQALQLEAGYDVTDLGTIRYLSVEPVAISSKAAPIKR